MGVKELGVLSRNGAVVPVEWGPGLRTGGGEQGVQTVKTPRNVAVGHKVPDVAAEGVAGHRGWRVCTG